MNTYYNEQTIGLLFGIYVFLIILIGILFVCGIVSHFLMAYSLNRIAKRHGHPHPSIAWFPYAQNFLYADLIGKEIQIGSFQLRHFPVFFVVAPVIWQWLSSILSSMSGILPPIILLFYLLSLLMSCFFIVLKTYTLYLFFKKYKKDKAVLYTVLSAIVPFAGPIIFFIIRDTASAEPYHQTSSISY